MADERKRISATCSRLEAAVYLGISGRTFDRIQKSQTIPFVQIGQRRRYLPSDLQNYLNANRTI